jgi:hypothetical protein
MLVLYPIRVDGLQRSRVEVAVLGGSVRGHEVGEWEGSQDCNDVYSTKNEPISQCQRTPYETRRRTTRHQQA